MLPKCATETRPLDDNPSLSAISERDHQKLALDLLQRHTDLSDGAEIVEVGGSIGENFSERLPNASYLNLDLEEGSVPDKTIVCDITKKIPLRSNSVNFIYSNNCFEHVNAPWLAARELVRILKPGGYIFVSVPWAWRYHPVPIDYWRFSPDALVYLFNGVTPLQTGFNVAYRRDDMSGFWPNKMDSVPRDQFGGFRENWLSYFFGVKDKNHSIFPSALVERLKQLFG